MEHQKVKNWSENLFHEIEIVFFAHLCWKNDCDLLRLTQINRLQVHNLTLGLVLRTSQILIIAYIVSFAIIYKKGYQVVSFCCLI